MTSQDYPCADRRSCTWVVPQRTVLHADCKHAYRVQVAAWIRLEVHKRTQLTCSVGIAANMTIAKICSDMRKPNGQFEVACTREAVMAFVQDLPIRKIPGIGKASTNLLLLLFRAHNMSD